MNPVAETLHHQGFSLDYTLQHQDLIPFVRRYLFTKNVFTISYLVITILFTGAWLMVSFFFGINNTLTFFQILIWSVLGFGISFLLAPVHELLHGIAYKLCGAQKISFKAHWKKLYIVAIADKFVTHRRAFYFIGLIPFVVISLGSLLLVVFSSPALQLTWLTTLWVHATMCAGDIGLLSYFAEHRNKELITYDDAESNVSYFYSKK